MSRRPRLLIGVVSVLAFFALWDGLGNWHVINQDMFPPIQAIFQRAAGLILSPSFVLQDLASSLRRLCIASILTLPLALILGMAAGSIDWLRAILDPFVNFTMPLPKVAIFPLALALFGVGDSGKVFLIGVGLFYPLLVNVLNGMLRLKGSDYAGLIHVYRIQGRRLWFAFYWKGLTVDILTGLKTSLAYGFTLVVVSELAASNNGIGNFIWRAWDDYQILDMYAALFWLCVLGWIVQTALDLALSRHLKRWPRPS